MKNIFLIIVLSLNFVSLFSLENAQKQARGLVDELEACRDMEKKKIYEVFKHYCEYVQQTRHAIPDFIKATNFALISVHTRCENLEAELKKGSNK